MAISLETLALASSMKGGSGGGGGGSALPSVRGSDNGKVLTVKAGRWQAVKPEKELPQASADYNGKILGIVNGAWSMIDIPVAEDELPAVTSEDDGKILGIVNGAWSMIDIPVAEDELPAVTSEDDGKVMVAKNGEWVSEELLTVGTEHVILPETEGIILNNQYNLDLTAFPSVSLTDLQYIAVHNGRRYELGTMSSPEGYFAVYPPDFDFTQLSDDNMPEVAIAMVQGDSASVCIVAILPEDTSHTLTLMAKLKTVVKDEHIPFAIKAGSGMCSITEGQSTTASGNYAHAEGYGTTASSVVSHTEGVGTTASGTASHAEGNITIASGDYSHAEGYGGTYYVINDVTYESGAKGMADHTEGYQTMTASGQPGNHAEGYRTKATGGAAHSEGKDTTASGQSSHAEGSSTTASETAAHAEGVDTTASMEAAHAEGRSTTANGIGSHAEGSNTTASGPQSHAEGNKTTASGNYSHAEGYYTIAKYKSQHVFGELNVVDTPTSTADAASRGTYVEIVGNGTANGTTMSRSNARTLDWDGNEVLAGKLTVGAAPTADMDVATKRYVDNKALPSVTTSDNGKVLSVVNGTWSAATASGGGGGVSAIAAGTGTNSVISGSVTGTGANTASGDNSIAAGVATIASHKSQVVIGEYNESDPSSATGAERGEYIEIVGNGYDEYSRSNARTLDWSGNETIGGNLTVNGNSITLGNIELTAEKLEALLRMVS